SILARRFGPFDERFPFYYEDDDLSLRVHRAGLRLCFVGNTRVIHFYNKSAGPIFDEVMDKYRLSKSYFFRKHFGPLGHGLYKASAEFLRAYRDRLTGWRFHPLLDLGDVSDPLELDLPEGQEAILELTLDPSYVMAVAHKHPGGPYRMPRETWDALDSTLYFLRVLDPELQKILALYRFEKTTHALASPSYRELKERWS
ncbi:MAG: hypothetical protein KJ645_03245, partial [Planctomycetes bacterium]|nr:hypothetical protein [Planctomycetota bacterium]